MGKLWSFEYLEMDCNVRGQIVGFVMSHSLLNMRNQNKRQPSRSFALIFNQSFSLPTKAAYLLKPRWYDDIKNLELNSCKNSLNLLNIQNCGSISALLNSLNVQNFPMSKSMFYRVLSIKTYISLLSMGISVPLFL